LRWEIVILLTMLVYPLAQTAEVHGASDTKTVDGITFAISADSNVLKGDLVAVTLSVKGNWSAFYGYLYYDETTFDSMIGPVYNGYDKTWSGTYYIPDLDIGCYTLTFWAKYWPKDWPFPPWYGPVTVSVQVCVVAPEPTVVLRWLTPVSNRDSFEAGSRIPIRFSVHDDTGNFIRDESVTVTITDETEQSVFSATYGTGRDEVRIRESAEYYIVSWKTPQTPGPYTISVEFQEILVESLLIELR